MGVTSKEKVFLINLYDIEFKQRPN
jgi:hypothetical protein